MSAKIGNERAKLTVKYPTTADRIPDGGDDSGSVCVARFETPQARGRRGQWRHGTCARGHTAPSTEIIGDGAGRGRQRCNKQTAAIRGAVSQPRQPELNADSVCAALREVFCRFRRRQQGVPHRSLNRSTTCAHANSAPGTALTHSPTTSLAGEPITMHSDTSR